MPRYRFHDFLLSPRRRVLLRDGREQPLIPRYFDLLVFLVEHRGEAVHRRDIFDRVWSDAVVSDSALSQAVRTIRRVLGDDSRDPRFVRTVSRHGYQFVCPEVVEEDDSRAWPTEAKPRLPASDQRSGHAARAPLEAAHLVADPAQPSSDGTPSGTAAVAARSARVEPSAPLAVTPLVDGAAPLADPYAPLIELVTRPTARDAEEEDQREAAERLHALGTVEALRRLDAGAPAHRAYARALLRDTRWDVAEAAAVPILGAPEPALVAWHLTRLRLRRAASLAAPRCAAASMGAGVAGALAGAAGGVLLLLSPGGHATSAIVPVLSAVGGACGTSAGAGVAAGVSVAESILRSWRRVALVFGGALGGGAVGLAAQLLGGWSLAVIVGLAPVVGGGLEGLVIGGAAGLGYALATKRADGGLAAPRGLGRLRAAGLTAAACALGALGLAVWGRPLVGGTLHAIARASASTQAQVVLTPLARLLGEPDFGPLTAALISMGEGAAFGLGLALGLTHRRLTD